MTYSVPSAPPSTTIASLRQQIQTYLGGPSVVASIDKIKILHSKKPVPASKQTIGDVISTTATKDLELGVMVLGGAPDPPPQDTTTTEVTARPPEPAGPGSENAAVEAETGLNPEETITRSADAMDVEPTTGDDKAESQSQPVQPGEDAGLEVLSSKEFWMDLEGFLAQRIRSQEEAVKLRSIFESAWRSNGATP